MLGNHRLIEERGQCSAEIEAVLHRHEQAGRSVSLLATASGVVALFAVADTIKPSSAAAIGELKAMGITPVMLTGDNRTTAESVAKKLGIREGATLALLGAPDGFDEVLAETLHVLSGRAGPLTRINCAALSESLLESELFGHEKGAFTGAIARRIGKFEEATGGTLLLDEISEMDARLQAKLLRALQERVIDRVGGHPAETV